MTSSAPAATARSTRPSYDVRVVVVKCAKVGNTKSTEQVLNEVHILCKVNHRSLVCLLGCYIELEQPLLVYEYIDNGTLFECLNGPNRVYLSGMLSYLDPEYYRNYQLMDKSDVYSCGVVLLELLTLQKAIDFNREVDDVNLAVYVQRVVEEERIMDVVDPALKKGASTLELETMKAMGFLAVWMLGGVEAEPAVHEGGDRGD
ncbi:protein kinase superfamily protein [Actinidia rufa]|uniref:Protein kinase superfamily protein n=1 Tax=Actinidia rufa TaxID=165716 RepID=A0A7J0DJX7_9ERIC|nr:protein kinase superfamily protein [Actinidia rufa]